MTRRNARDQAMRRLAQIAALQRDARLADYAAVAHRRQDIEDALRRMPVPVVLDPEASSAPVSDPGGAAGAPMPSDGNTSRPPAAALPLPAALAHARWVLSERGRLLSLLARTRAEEAPVRAAAATATGRAAVLDRLYRRGSARR